MSRSTTTYQAINPALLLLSSIQSAIDDLLHGHTQEQRDAFHWLYMAEENTPMSFLWCCDAIGLDPVRVRTQCHRLRPGRIQALHQDARSHDINDLTHIARRQMRREMTAAR